MHQHPTTRRRATLAAAVTTAAILAACAGGVTAPEVRSPRGATSPALRSLVVTVEPASLTLAGGDTLAVRVRVVNRAGGPVVVVGSGSCTVLLEVYDASGAAVEPTRSRVCTLDCRAYTFAPDRAYVLDARFTARNWSNADQRHETLRPGTYQLVGRVSGSLGSCDGPAVQAASAPVLVALR